MNKKTKQTYLIFIVFLLILALLISIHQYITWGVFFELNDIHHETFIIALLFGAILTYILLIINKKS